MARAAPPERLETRAQRRLCRDRAPPMEVMRGAPVHGHAPDDRDEEICRHSRNQGTTGRPARAHCTLQWISLRTRHSKPGEALQAWRGSPSLASLAEGKPSARDLSSRGHKAKGSARPPA